jgi:hypothetical protein
MARFPALFTVFACALVATVRPSAAASPFAEEHRHHVGVNTAYLPNLKQETLRKWVRDSGAATPRVGMRMDLFQKGMPDHADPWVRDFPGGGRSAVAFLFNESVEVTYPDGKKGSGCKPPAGLNEPVFTNGTDEPTPEVKINPKNEWAAFVNAMAERYDGDGRDDAPGSPKVTWFSVWNEPDWMPWPRRPKTRDERSMRNWFGRDPGDLARLAFVSHRAGKFANAECRVGMQLCFPETLGFLLDDPKHPLAKNCDFIDFHAYGGKTGDDNCFRNDGIVPVAKSMRAEYTKRKLPPPALMCTETGVPGGPPGGEQAWVQSAAVVKAMVVGASEDLVTTCWYALTDPSWDNMGLIGDASKLPSDGKGAEFRPSYAAMATIGKLLAPTTVFVREARAGKDVHAYQFRDGEGRTVWVLWLDDSSPSTDVAPEPPPFEAGTWDVLLFERGRPIDWQRVELLGRDGVSIAVGKTPVILRRPKQ